MSEGIHDTLGLFWRDGRVRLLCPHCPDGITSYPACQHPGASHLHREDWHHHRGDRRYHRGHHHIDYLAAMGIGQRSVWFNCGSILNQFQTILTIPHKKKLWMRMKAVVGSRRREATSSRKAVSCKSWKGRWSATAGGEKICSSVFGQNPTPARLVPISSNKNLK